MRGSGVLRFHCSGDLAKDLISAIFRLDSLIVRRELCGRGGGLDNGEDGNCEKISLSTSRKYLDNQTDMPKDENDNRKPQRNILPDESNNNCHRSSSVTTDKPVENSNVGKNVNKLSRPVTTKVSNKVQPVPRVIDKYTDDDDEASTRNHPVRKEISDFVGFSNYIHQVQRRRRRNNRSLKIAVMGEKGVGKTTFIRTFIQNSKIQTKEHKTFTEYIVTESVDDKEYTVTLIEFKGKCNVVLSVQIMICSTQAVGRLSPMQRCGNHPSDTWRHSARRTLNGRCKLVIALYLT